MEEKVPDRQKIIDSYLMKDNDIRLYKEAVKASKEAKRIAEKERRRKEQKNFFRYYSFCCSLLRYISDK
jgi:hypothetical protein